ncbi:MAG: hypothetical protein XD57_1021 [Thermotoga petrophila]|uniref:Uncharacterized protein n=1 Tax=Thermotoga petrophila TaxID=93929 RepID=A0A101EQM8_9THEM|nr:MAG: hypothetical protein XD57_1021 [Thermotoga petrophila]
MSKSALKIKSFPALPTSKESLISVTDQLMGRKLEITRIHFGRMSIGKSIPEMKYTGYWIVDIHEKAFFESVKSVAKTKEVEMKERTSIRNEQANITGFEMANSNFKTK